LKLPAWRPHAQDQGNHDCPPAGTRKTAGNCRLPQRQAEWITLVYLHSGLLNRDQLAFFLQGANRFYVRRCVKALLNRRVSSRPFADERVADGRLICRIVGKQIYRELEIPRSRHRRETSPKVTRRGLLSLDFVLDHLELPWLPTEKEKVSCFEHLGIERDLLPRRIYSGHAKGMPWIPT